MSKRDRIGVIVLIGLFTLFGLIIVLMSDRPQGGGRGIENNVLIEQRMKSQQP